MTQTIRSDMIRKLIAVAVVLGSTSAQAQNCVQYPPVLSAVSASKQTIRRLVQR